MPPDKNQNINLIPGDLERQRQVIKQVIAAAPREYTDATIDRPEAKPSFWSKLVAAKPKSKTVKNEPAKVEIIKPTRLPTRPQLKSLPNDVAIPPAVAPQPNFLTAQPVAPKKVISPPPPPAAPLPKPKSTPPPFVPGPAKPPIKKIEMTVAADNGKKDTAAGENFGVNLLSAEYASAFITQNQKSFFTYGLSGTIVSVILIFAGLHLYQTQKSHQVERSQQANAELEGAILSFSDLEKEDQVLGRKVAVIKELLGGHISIRAFLEKLEAATIPEVTFLALAAAPAGGITVTARATSYTTLARQLTVLQESAPWIKEVTVAAAGLVHGKEGQADSVEFDMVLKVDPNIFKTSEAK